MEDRLEIGGTYHVHFVWKLPDYDYIRAVFMAEVVEIDLFEERYVARLKEMVGGRQEAPDGSIRPNSEMTLPLWKQVVGFAGRRVRLPWESADGKPIHLKYTTLTGEHNFFSRYED